MNSKIEQVSDKSAFNRLNHFSSIALEAHDAANNAEKTMQNETDKVSLNEINTGITTTAANPVTDHRPESNLPSNEVLIELVGLYFKHIHPWFPVLHEQQTWDKVLKTGSSETLGSPPLLYAIVATTLRFMPNKLPATEQTRYHDKATQKLLCLALDTPTLDSFEALVVLLLDIIGFSNGPKGWGVLAMVSTIAVKLGLSRERRVNFWATGMREDEDEVNTSAGGGQGAAPKIGASVISTSPVSIIPDSVDFISEERRRRLFWGAYILDRFASVASSFMFNIPSQEIFRRLPCSEEIWSRKTSESVSPTRWFSYMGSKKRQQETPQSTDLGAYAYQIELLGILSEIHEFLRRPFDIGSTQEVEQWQLEYRKLDISIAEWKLSLPEQYGTVQKIVVKLEQSNTVDSLWVMLHSLYHTVIIRLHSLAGYPYRQSNKFRASQSARQRCVEAVQNIVLLTKMVHNAKILDRLGPHYAWTLWVAARLTIVHSFKTKSELPTADIDILVGTLSAMGGWWGVARRYATILIFVIEEHKRTTETTSFRKGHREGKRGRILSDMRWTASDLDYLMTTNSGIGSTSATTTDGEEESEQTAMQYPSQLAMPMAQPAVRHTFSQNPRQELKEFDDYDNSVAEIEQEFVVGDMFEWFSWPRGYESAYVDSVEMDWLRV